MPLTPPLSAALGTLALVCLSCTAQAQTPAAHSPEAPASAAQTQRLDAAYAHLPLSFEPNRGQAEARVQFIARSPQSTLFLSGADAVLETSVFRKDAHGTNVLAGTTSVQMHLAGAAPAPQGQPEQPLSGRMNYLRGNNSAHWQTDVPTYGGVHLASVYPGVDLRYYGHAGQLEYDFVVAPGAESAAIKLQFPGSTPRLDPNGDLVLPAAHAADLRFDRPVAYQTIDGRRVPVEAAFNLAANQDVTFQLGSYDHTRELVIDPTLIYLGTLGSGIGQTNVGQIAVDSTGALYFIGTTNETAYPTTVGSFQPVCGPANATAAGTGTVYCNNSNNTSAYITKLSADGTKLVYSTFLSGHGGVETGAAIAVDAAGVAYLFGRTGSDDFPITSDAFQKRCYSYYGAFNYPNPAACDGFYNGGGTQYTINNVTGYFAKLSATGSSLLYSSFLGGSQAVYPAAIGLDTTGNIYLYGQTDVLTANDLKSGNVQFTGLTSSGFQYTPSTAITQGNSTGAYDINAAAFLSKFSNDGHTLLYGTFFADYNKAADILPTTLAVGSNGIAYIGGYSKAVNLNSTAGTLKTACTFATDDTNCSSYDGFVASFDTTKGGAASLVFATRLGGSSITSGSNAPNQQVLGLATDSSNNVYATGFTLDHTFPMAKAGYQTTCPNYNPLDSFDRCDSAWLLKINPTGTAILAGSFLGGPDPRAAESVGYNVRLDSKGQVYLYGRSNDGGSDFPQVNPLQAYKGGNQLFISVFTTDLTKLIFSTRFGNPSYVDHSVSVAGGMVLDSADNIYFAGTTTDTTFAGTAGTYSTTTTAGAGNHTFFAKLSKVLQPTTTTLTVPTTTVTAGSSITLKAVVTGTLQSAPAATGTVTFSYTNTTPATVAGTAMLDATGTATLTTTAPAAGTYTVVASYAADATYDVSTSTAATLTTKTIATPGLTLATSATTGNPGTSFTFNATLTSASGTPTGTIYFMDGTATLGSAVVAGSGASYSTVLAIGTHAITARYSGDANNAPVSSSAQSVTVTTYPSATTLTTSAASVVFGSPVTLAVTVAGTGSTAVPTGTVTFLDGSTSLGTAPLKAGSATFTTTALATGTHSITAAYGGDASFSSTSAAVTETIVAASVTLSASPTSLTVTRGTTGTVTITATPTGLLTGSVTFACGTVPQHTTCMFSPTTLTFNASATSQTTTLSFATNTAALELPRNPFTQSKGIAEALAAGFFLPLGLAGLARRRRKGASAGFGLLLLLLASAGIAGLSGCGGTQTFNSTSAGTYSVPVTATVNGGTSTLSLSITVQ